MLPSLGELLATQHWVARRFGRRPDCDPARLAEALDEATALAGGRMEDEPAALLFALLRRGRAIPDTWDTLPLIVAVNHAARTGVALALPPTVADREDLLLAVAGKLLTFNELRHRVRPR